jgi:hypothetical protein
MNLTDAEEFYFGETHATAVQYGSQRIWSRPWKQLGSAIQGSAGNRLGASVSIESIDGNRIVVGSPYKGVGAVRVFDWTGAAWSQVGSEILGNSSISGEFGFGTVVSFSGSRFAAATLSGRVRVYEWNSNTSDWVQLGSDILQESGTPNSAEAQFGKSLSLRGSTLAIGAPNGLNGSGYTRVYEFTGKSWEPENFQWKQLGNDILSQAVSFGVGNNKGSGWAVKLDNSGTRLVIGEKDWSESSNHVIPTGSAGVFEYRSGFWNAMTSRFRGETPEEQNGYSVSISGFGSRIAVSAPSYGSDNLGITRIFEEPPSGAGGWSQLGNSIIGEGAGDLSGVSVELNYGGDIVAIGSELANGSGKIRLYKLINDSWVKLGADINGASAGDNFSIVALNGAGDRLAVGGQYNDSGGANAGHVRAFQFI